MINEEKTQDLFGYKSTDLKRTSKHKIVLICDFCYKEFIRPKVCTTCGNNPNKHCCGIMQCRVLKAKDTNMMKYGVSNVMHIPSIKAKMGETIQKYYGVTNASQCSSIVEKKRETYRKKNNGLMLSEWAKTLGKAGSTFGQQVKRYGLEHALKITRDKTGLELKTEELLIQNNINYVSEYTIANYRVDFLVENKIALEANGHWWHSDARTNKNYHKNKREEYLKHNLIPMFFTEEEIYTKNDIVVSIINDRLDKLDLLNVDQCCLTFVDNHTCQDFLSKNHLIGIGSGEAIGLYYKNELVAILQYINNEKYIEITRFCNKINMKVVGSFSEFISYLERFNKNILTLVDFRYESDKDVVGIGFKHKKKFIGFRWVKDLKSANPDDFPNNSGYDTGWHKMWDCGQAKYMKYNAKQ